MPASFLVLDSPRELENPLMYPIHALELEHVHSTACRATRKAASSRRTEALGSSSIVRKACYLRLYRQRPPHERPSHCFGMLRRSDVNFMHAMPLLRGPGKDQKQRQDQSVHMPFTHQEPIYKVKHCICSACANYTIRHTRGRQSTDAVLRKVLAFVNRPPALHQVHAKTSRWRCDGV